MAPLYPFIIFSKSSTPSISRLVVGSSAKRRGAWLENAAPMARLVFSPPLFTALSRSFNWLKSLASGSSSVSPVWRISAMGQYRFTTPSSQAILPDRTPKRVDFPAPLRPMSPILSPSRISSFSISSTVWIPYSFLTFSAFNNIKKSLLNALRSEGI